MPKPYLQRMGKIPAAIHPFEKQALRAIPTQNNQKTPSFPSLLGLLSQYWEIIRHNYQKLLTDFRK